MKIRYIAVLPALLLSWSAQADCVSCSCSVSTTSLAFPAYHPIGQTPADSSSSISVSCSGSGTPVYSIALSKGASPDYSKRRMASGSNYLYYNLFTSNSYGTVWGDGTEETQVVSGSMQLLLSSRTNHTVYGRIPAGQRTVIPGSYADTIMVTVTYN